MKECPACKKQFGMCRKIDKKRYCRHCGVEIYYPGGKLNGQVMLMEERQAAVDIIMKLQEIISERSGTEFVFMGQEYHAELSFAYSLILRARAYLDRQVNDYDWTPGSFSMDLFMAFMKQDWWRQNTTTLRMLGKYVSAKANEIYIDRKTRRTQEEAVKSSTGDFRLPEGAAWV